jgi:hypothetical protein
VTRLTFLIQKGTVIYSNRVYLSIIMLYYQYISGFCEVISISISVDTSLEASLEVALTGIITAIL